MRRILIGVALLAFLTGCSVPETSETATPAGASEKPAKPQGDTFGDGTWRVGADVKPGTYRANAKTGCYWERQRGFGGDPLKDIISNGVSGSDGPVTVTIKKTDVGFRSQLCGTWTKI
jgi:hypothetical protein